jgi:hypothetical protein
MLKPIASNLSQYAPNMEVLPTGVYEESTLPDLTGHISAFLKTPEGIYKVFPGDYILVSLMRDKA